MLVSGSVYAPDLKIRLCLRNKNYLSTNIEVRYFWKGVSSVVSTYHVSIGVKQPRLCFSDKEKRHITWWSHLSSLTARRRRNTSLEKVPRCQNAVGSIFRSHLLNFHGNLAKLYQIMIFHQPGVPWNFRGSSPNLSYLLGWKLVWGRYKTKIEPENGPLPGRGYSFWNVKKSGSIRSSSGAFLSLLQPLSLYTKFIAIPSRHTAIDCCGHFNFL